MTSVAAESIFQTFQIPPLQRANPADPIASTILTHARAIERANQVAIGIPQIEDPQAYAQALRAEIQQQLPVFNEVETRVFAGATSRELQDFLQAAAGKPQKVVLESEVIKVDETIIVPSNTSIEGRNTHLSAPPEFRAAVFEFPAGTRRAALVSLSIEAELAVLLRAAQQIRLQQIDFIGGRAVTILGGSDFIELAQLHMDKAKFGAVMAQGDVARVWLHHCRFTESQRADNGGAAVLLTDALDKPSLEAHSHHDALAEAILPLAPAPHALLIEQNELSDNRAQGLYVDGAYGVVIQHNLIKNNDKEGLCLDFGAVNNLVMENAVLGNGQRARQTDEELKLDWVLEFGRMADGSAIAKLPGIALDNAAQNLILSNTVRDNAGDGIKIVRSGFRNLILFNSITANNRGASSRFQFFGILLGSAGIEQALAGEDMSKHPLDFLPPLENIVAGNLIYGAHRAGVLLDKGAIFNDVYDNQVRHFRVAPLESASEYFNSIIGNSWQPAAIPPVSCLSRLWSLKGMIVLLVSVLLVSLLLRALMVFFCQQQRKQA